MFQQTAGLKLFSGIIFIFALIFSDLQVKAQNIENIHLEKVREDELPNDYIECINQDAKGFVWFGTREGLFRFDGYSYKAFRNSPADSSSIIANAVKCICPDRNNLWIGTSGGLSCIDINTLKVKKSRAPGPLQVFAILPKNDSVFWVGTSIGLFEFDKANAQWKKIDSFEKNVFVQSLCYDHKGHLYVAAKNGFYCYNVFTQTYKFYNPDLSTYPQSQKKPTIVYRKALLDHEGNLWLGTWDAGLVRFNITTEEIKVWSYPTDDVRFIPYKIVTDLLFDKDQNLWLANKEGGLTIYNPAKDKFFNYPVEWKSDSKLSGGVVSLFKDRSGIVWVGTENGIFKYDPHSISLFKKDLMLKTDSGIFDTHISPLSMLKDSSDIWWMGMYEGLFVFDYKTGILVDYNKQIGIPESSAVYNIIPDKNGVLWMVAKNMLVKVWRQISKNKINIKSEIYKSVDITSSMCTLYIDKEDRIWIGTHSNGVFRFDAASKKFIPYAYGINSKGKANEIRAFCELSKDSMLVAGEHTGLYLLHVDKSSYQKITWPNIDQLVTDPSINSLFKNGSALYIGTEFNGLWQTNTTLISPTVMTVNDGLPSQSIGSITGDQQNNLWLLTNAGAVEIQASDKKITIFDKRSGIHNLNELNAIISDSAGNVYIGSRGAIYAVNASNIIKNKKPPQVLITDLKVFDEDYVIKKDEAIKLNYNQNYFSFEYVALNYTQSRLNKYAYKMVGLDKKWNYVGSRRYVSYANLDEGTYTFYVKACNNEGVWTNTPAKLTLIIEPPFWHRWWFYSLCLLFLFGSVYIIYRYNLNQFKIRLQLRDKIARDLHDDIGSTLSGINIFSKIALQKINSDKKGSRELLEKISDRSEKTLDALSDIVWSINTRHDGLDNFLVKVHEYLSEVLEPQSIAYELEVDKELEHLKIGMAVRKELYLIFKEAICNASKYAKCTLIKISFAKHKDSCELIICDNGKGFNLADLSSGNGIYNMKHRAQKINAALRFESEPGKGTCVTLSFHIPRFR